MHFVCYSTINGLDVIVVGESGNVFYSANGGTSWTSATSGTTSDIQCIAHVSNSVALIGGLGGYLAKTINGGATWTTITNVLSSSSDIKNGGISVVSSTNYYVATLDGKIYSTENGGSSWSIFDSKSYAGYFSIAMLSNIKGIAGGSTDQGIYLLVPSKCHLFSGNMINSEFSMLLSI